MRYLTTLIILLFLSTSQVMAQWEANYDEEKVPSYEIPDPLQTFKGKKVKNAKQWVKKRRPELMEFFTQNVYGEVPGKVKMTGYEIVEESNDAFGGKANRKQVRLSFEKNEKTLEFMVLLYLPKSVKQVPVFVGYNFYGNHTVAKDVNLIISEAWTRSNESLGVANHQLTEQSRGMRSDRWVVEKLLDGGYGLVTVYCAEVDPDRNDFSDGIHPFFYKGAQQVPSPNEWGTIGAWAWGLSRTLDYLDQDPDVDASRAIVFGHSRLGKTSLWAGATDERFAGVISNNSGCGGAALSKRRFGETVWRINNSFPHWFCRNFRKFNKREDTLPVDQHELIALIAPRPVYVASAVEDRWADPRGEYLSAYYATPVYELYGKKGIESAEMPKVNAPLLNWVGYHIRTGGHGVTEYDWEQYINWADKYIK